ncbi:head decoration protein [Francisella philomiragia]|uniref:Head decoration protein n=1 Tax=Francisella philomiragia TaxID=28110 RepID=A0ABS1GC77_9GAMM|nr:head decoration protein [Francisella philomiragia]MBK2258728.1 head decoration protein [Francisella philomiragia]MBK2302419.1 head decoration protein [Francisella philomiragia]
MSNISTTNIDTSPVFIEQGTFEDGVLTLAGAATVKAGTILAVDSSTQKYVLFVKGGNTNENGIPKAVLTYDLVATGAGDRPVRVGLAGDVRLDKLIINADGDNSNVDKTVMDQLRDYGIVVRTVKNLSSLDNQ